MRPGALVRRSSRRAAGLFFGLMILLGGFQFVLVLVARTLQQSQTLTQLGAFIPPMFQQAVGTFMFASFGGMVSFGYLHPIVILVFVEAAIFLAAEPAWEVESGVVDLVLARPVPRGAVFARSFLVMLGCTALVALTMTVATRVALQLLAPPSVPWPPLRTTAILALNLTAVAWCFGALSLLVASRARRRSTVLGIAGLGAVFLYLLNFVAEVWTAARPLAVLSPFHYYDAVPIIAGAGRAWVADVTVLCAAAAGLSVLGWRLYLRRDL